MSVAVSIVIPVYNAEKYIAECLDQLLCQSETDIEIICVNDGSSDDTENILRRYVNKDSRIQAITQENKGAGEARNHGLSLATGEYVIFLDADDKFDREMIGTMLDSAGTHDADVTICRADSFCDATGELDTAAWQMPPDAFRGKDCFSPQEMCDILFQMVQGWPWDKLFRTEFIKEHNLIYPDLPNSHDLVFVLQGLVLAERISVTRDILVHRRTNVNGSISNSRADSWDSPYRAVQLFTESLKKNDMLDMYERSLYIWAWDLFLWNLCTLPAKARRSCYKAMQKEWIPTLGLQKYHADYPNSHRLQMTVIRRFPYWVFAFLKRVRSLFRSK